MSMFCQDKDLLSIEPVVFIGGGLVGQVLVSGTDGALSGTTFTSAASDFHSAGIAAGMVLCTYLDNPAEGTAVEVVSVDSATQLTVSVLRADADADPIAPPAGSNLGFYIRTFTVQIDNVSGTLAEKLRQMLEVAGISKADFADSQQLRMTAVSGCLSSIFVARADNATDQDANWVKAEHYRDQFYRQQLQLRLAIDADGDGKAEQTRTLGSITLRRL